jgi:hypothetical protein
LSWRGAWSAIVTYAVDDGVEYGGASYIAVAASTADAPPSGAWSLLAAQGGTGPQGPAGIFAVSGPFSYDSSSQTLSGIAADGTHAGYVTTGVQTFAGAKYGQAFIGRDVLGCADVRAFGAVGDDVADDTAAIQAAIDSFGAGGGPVCFPRGTFKLSCADGGTALFLKVASSLRGAASTQSTQPPYSGANGTILDAAGCLGTAIMLADSSRGVRIEDLTLVLFDERNVTDQRIYGIDASSGGNVGISLRNVTVQQGYVGMLLSGSKGHVDDSTFQAQRKWGLSIGGNYHRVAGGLYANALGWLGGANIVVQNGSIGVSIRDLQVDESFGPGVAGILVLGADQVHIDGVQMFYNHDGYGLRFGDGLNNPTNCSVRGVHVSGFAPGNAPIAAVEVRGSGHVLQSVYADVSADLGAAGTAISDLATGTVEIRTARSTSVGLVYTSFKDPSLPSTNPGPGSKQLWYDPDDGNRVKFAP